MTTSGEQLASWQGLVGATVHQWFGREMAIEEDPVQFSVPQIPFLQMEYVYLDTTRGRWKLWPKPAMSDEPSDELALNLDPSGAGSDWPLGRTYSSPIPIVRDRLLPELPAGRVTEVEVVVEHDTPQELQIRFSDGRNSLFVCGEVGEPPVVEEWKWRFKDYPYGWCRYGDWILVFPEPSDAKSQYWTPPRSAP